MLEDRILRALREECHYDQNRPLVAGVSGGADSLTLAHCLRMKGINFLAGHFDHGLRPSSTEEAVKVSNLMSAWGIPCEVGKGKIRLISQNLHMGIEEAARVCRYQFLFSLAARTGAQAVVVAHNADDQVETVLMHFLRGTGINGLSGMQPVSYLKQINPDILIFRPMLSVFRGDILEYCQDHQLPFLSDESNLDTTFFRNRLRLELIPKLETYNPAFKMVMLRIAETMRYDRELLTELEDKAFTDCLIPGTTSGLLSFDRNKFLTLDEGLQRRIVMRVAQVLKPNFRNLGLEQIKRALDAIREGVKRTDFVSNLEIWVEEDSFHIFVRGLEPEIIDVPQLPAPCSYELAVGGKLTLKRGWWMNATMLDSEGYKRLPQKIKNDSLHAFINPADLEPPLEVRPINAGERWSPLGMGLKHQKLSDFFINNKVPQAARIAWPLVLSGGSIIWVAGLRIAQAWRLRGDETQILHLQLHPGKKPTP